MIKLGLVFSVTLLAFSVQIYSVDAQSTDAITDLLDELKEVVNKSIIDVSTALDEEISKLQANASAIQEETEAKIAKRLEDFKAKLDMFIEATAAYGVDIQECLEDTEDNLNQNLTEIFDNFVGNVSLIVEDADEYALLVLAKVRKANDEVAEIEKAIESCGNDDASDNCLDDLNTRIEGDIKAVPKAAADEVENAKKSIESASSNIQNFATWTIDECFVEENELLAVILDCINEELHI